jgi:hypothetical protein
MSDLDELAADLEAVPWREVEGVSAATAATFARKLRQAD